MQEALISIIIPAYNSENFIEETIRSVIAQSYKNWELVIVDDGSTDNQNELIEKLIIEDIRISLFLQQNKGVSAARNFGYSKTKGAFVAFLDADDVWLPDNLKLKYDKIIDSDFGLVHSDAMLIDQDSKTLNKTLKGKEGNLLNDLLLWKGPHIPGPSSILVTRNAIETVGQFDEDLSTSADYDFFIRVASQFQIGRVPCITWHYRMHASNMHSNITSMEKDLLYVFKKSKSSGLFTSEGYKRKCKSKMYLVLGLSFIGKNHNFVKGIYYVIRSITTEYSILVDHFFHSRKPS